MAGETTSNSTKPFMTARSKLWLGILVVYLLLFISTGYLAFLARDHSPTLDQNSEKLVAGLSDEKSKAVVMNALKEEDDEYDRRTALANHAFNIVLGSLLGFLAATAVSRVGRNTEG